LSFYIPHGIRRNHTTPTKECSVGDSARILPAFDEVGKEVNPSPMAAKRIAMRSESTAPHTNSALSDRNPHIKTSKLVSFQQLLGIGT